MSMPEDRGRHPEDQSPEAKLASLRAKNFSTADDLISSALALRIMQRDPELQTTSFQERMFTTPLQVGIPGEPYKEGRIRQEVGIEVGLSNEHFAYYSFRRVVHPTMSEFWLAVVVLPDL